MVEYHNRNSESRHPNPSNDNVVWANQPAFSGMARKMGTGGKTVLMQRPGLLPRIRLLPVFRLRPAPAGTPRNLRNQTEMNQTQAPRGHRWDLQLNRR